MSEKKDHCLIYNNIGQCIKWEMKGDKLHASFTEEAKECAPKLFKEFEQFTREKKLVIKI
jgi:hypothetical protein